MKRIAFEVEIKGEKIAADYEVSSGRYPLVTVFYHGERKSTQQGGLPPHTVARMLLGELVRGK